MVITIGDMTYQNELECDKIALTENVKEPSLHLGSCRPECKRIYYFVSMLATDRSKQDYEITQSRPTLPEDAVQIHPLLKQPLSEYNYMYEEL